MINKKVGNFQNNFFLKTIPSIICAVDGPVKVPGPVWLLIFGRFAILPEFSLTMRLDVSSPGISIFVMGWLSRNFLSKHKNGINYLLSSIVALTVEIRSQRRILVVRVRWGRYFIFFDSCESHSSKKMYAATGRTLPYLLIDQNGYKKGSFSTENETDNQEFRYRIIIE